MVRITHRMLVLLVRKQSEGVKKELLKKRSGQQPQSPQRQVAEKYIMQKESRKIQS